MSRRVPGSRVKAQKEMIHNNVKLGKEQDRNESRARASLRKLGNLHSHYRNRVQFVPLSWEACCLRVTARVSGHKSLQLSGMGGA